MSSSSEEEWEFEFIVVLNGDPLGIHRLSDKFAEFIAGKELAALSLWEASCGFCRWTCSSKGVTRCTFTLARRSSRALTTSKPAVCSTPRTKAARR
jgi:hypothetical protein